MIKHIPLRLQHVTLDLVVVGLGLLPDRGGLSALRGLRVIRAMRLLSVVPQMRAVVQALLDAFTIRQKMGRLGGVKVLMVGDILHSRVAMSNLFCLRKLGAEVRVTGPATLLPPHLEDMGFPVMQRLDEALEWCDVANVLRIQHERQAIRYLPSLREYALYFGINKARLQKLSHPLVIMHPGPINRGVELQSDVADGPHSVILQQVENGVAVRMAVLYLLADQIRNPIS